MPDLAVGGIHHVTAIAANAQRNFDFYTGVLGLRLVKQTVNQDDPFTYHLYYGDSLGRPGTALTFFPFPGVPEGRTGRGQVYETAVSVPSGSVATWDQRLARAGATRLGEEERFGVRVLRFRDPDGLILALAGDAAEQSEPGWSGGHIPADEAVRAFSHARLASASPDGTARVLTDILGYTEVANEAGATRFAVGGADRAVSVDMLAAAASARSGSGTVHHVAFRVPDREALLAMREQILAAGLYPTPLIERFYFRSVYFREPGGILFEVATDDPGFTLDEDASSLGQSLKLPGEYEGQRRAIEAALPPLRGPAAEGAERP
jgi:glyoxalase family protein